VVGKQAGTNDYQDGYSLGISGDGKATAYGKGSGVQTLAGTIKTNENRWYHLVGVLTPTVTKIYVDGQLTSGPGTTVDNSSTRDTIIGAGMNGSDPSVLNEHFTGLIDDVRIYNVALTDAQVSELYNYRSGTRTTINLASNTTANSDTNWHHYGLSYNGTNAILYLDGVAVDTKPLNGNLAENAASDLLIGKTISGNVFDGALDSVRFYDKVLTADEVKYMYNGSQYGDVSGDGSLGLFDAVQVAQYSVGQPIWNSLTPAEFQAKMNIANVTDDTNVTVFDASYIAQKAVGLILKFPRDINEE
jgi:hypothetical protein